jgi:CHAD domain-containing protein
MEPMSKTHYQFTVPSSLSIAQLREKLRSGMPLEEDPVEELSLCYYDSFDWRVYARNQRLVAKSGNGASRLHWQSLTGGETLVVKYIREPPRFVWDLPPGPVRERLEPVLERRALLPQARIRSKVQNLRLVNAERKTVLHLAIEENCLIDGSGKTAHQLENRLRLAPIKGYRKPLRRTARLLEQGMALAPAREDLLLLALEALGRQPAEYSSKFRLALEPQMRADLATRTILQELLDAIEANEAGTRADEDSEFLHDFRVAVRRTRSALGQIKSVFPQQALERFRPRFAWLGQITGPTRDLDVYLLQFDEYRGSLPAHMQAHLDPLLVFLHNHRRTEQRKLAKELGSARYRQLLKDWRAFLESPPPQRSTLPNARRPIIGLASERIWRVYRRAIKEGRAIGPDTPAAALHELRKTCKKLRYLLEFFQSLYPSNKTRKLVKRLKGLQDNLGAFQDLEVQAATLKRFGEQMLEEGQVPVDTLMAMGMLIDGLYRRQETARKEFSVRFGEFASAEERKLFTSLFRSPAKEETIPA